MTFRFVEARQGLLTRSEVARLAGIVNPTNLTGAGSFPRPVGRLKWTGAALVYDAAAVLAFLEARRQRQEARRQAQLARERAKRNRPPRPSPLERFLRKADRTSGAQRCWKWRGAVNVARGHARVQGQHR